MEMGQLHSMGKNNNNKKKKASLLVVIQSITVTKARKFKDAAQGRYSQDTDIKVLGLNSNYVSSFVK